MVIITLFAAPTSLLQSQLLSINRVDIMFNNIADYFLPVQQFANILTSYMHCNLGVIPDDFSSSMNILND